MFECLSTRFAEIAEQNREKYAAAEPFPHLAIDGLFDEQDLAEILDEFPAQDDSIWHRSEQQGIQVKLRSNWKSDREIRTKTRQLIQQLNSGDMLRALSKLTGIDGLIPDPYLTGGGLNCILPGGQLAVHCDGNWHDLMRVHRRLNLIVFLNRDWQETWGGDLQLWDESLTQCVTRIFPLYNRTMIFTTHDFTYHGHPEPLACPPGHGRKSLILYYYTAYPRPPEHTATTDMHRAQWKVSHDGQAYSKLV